MNKNKIKKIIKFSFYKDIQNKWFIIFNVITLISILLLMNFNSLSSLFKFEKDTVFTVEVIDNDNLMYDNFYLDLSKDTNFNISLVNENNYTPETIPDNLAIIEVFLDEEELIKFSITSKEGIKGNIYEKITSSLKYSRNTLFEESYGISIDELEILQSDLSIERIMLSVDAENSTTKDMIKLISSAITYFIAILIFSKLSNEIAQEKQSKSSEYILTTVSEKEYLFAKIFSNVFIILIQGIFIMAYYLIASLFSRIITLATTDISLSASILLDSISAETIVYILALIIYNILNIILLCVIQATLASKTASISEAGNTMTLLTTIVIACYIIASTVIDPYSKVNIFLAIISCFPILSEFFIPALMVIGQCSVWQIILSLVLLLVAIPLTFNYCSKIFKRGILDYTKVRKNEIKNRTDDFLLKRNMKDFGFIVGLSILIYISIQSIFSLLGSFTLKPLLGNIFTDTEISLIMQIVLQVLSLGLASIFVLAYCNHKSTKLDKYILLTKKINILLVAIFLVFTLQMILSIVIYPYIGLDYDITDMFEINADSSTLTKIIAILAISITPAIFEELFFRKAVIDFTLQYGKKFALIFSALLFGLIHMNLSQGLFAFIMGLILGFIYLYTKDIKLTMAIHFINNCVATLAMILTTTWQIMLGILLLILLVTGLVLFIKLLINKSIREKFLSLCTVKISIHSIKKYRYIFLDYTFDIAIILVIFMSILTENILR